MSAFVQLILSAPAIALCSAVLIRRCIDSVITLLSALIAVLSKDPKRNQRAMSVLRLMVTSRSEARRRSAPRLPATDRSTSDGGDQTD